MLIGALVHHPSIMFGNVLVHLVANFQRLALASEKTNSNAGVYFVRCC